MKMYIYLLFALIICFVTLVFTLGNVAQVNVWLGFYSTTASLAGIILFSFLMGFLFCLALTLPKHVANSFQIFNLEKQIQAHKNNASTTSQVAKTSDTDNKGSSSASSNN